MTTRCRSQRTLQESEAMVSGENDPLKPYEYSPYYWVGRLQVVAENLMKNTEGEDAEISRNLASDALDRLRAVISSEAFYG
jgi:hypothetical protein